MYIHEAVSLAMAKGKHIRRTTPEIWDSVTAEPTNDPEGIILHAEGQRPGPRWEPRAEDLMADDWVLVD